MNQRLREGLHFAVHEGFMDLNVRYFLLTSPARTGVTSDLSSLESIEKSTLDGRSFDDLFELSYSIEWRGYIMTPLTVATEYTFFLSSSELNSTFLWIGPEAKHGYKLSNNEYIRGSASTQGITKRIAPGQRYPIRIMYGKPSKSTHPFFHLHYRHELFSDGEINSKLFFIDERPPRVVAAVQIRNFTGSMSTGGDGSALTLIIIVVALFGAAIFIFALNYYRFRRQQDMDAGREALEIHDVHLDDDDLEEDDDDDRSFDDQEEDDLDDDDIDDVGGHLDEEYTVATAASTVHG